MLYAALLDREPDADGLSAAAAEIQAGNIDAQVAAMARSAEFRQLIAGESETEILEQFYRGILARAGDSAGMRPGFPRLSRGPRLALTV